MKKIVIQNLLNGILLFAVMFIFRTAFLYRNLNLETFRSTALSSATIALATTLILGIYQLIYVRASKTPLVNFDLNPRQSALFMVDKSIEDAKDIIENILPHKLSSSQFNYDIKTELFKSKTGATLSSWGEIIGIKITKVDNLRTQLSVFSKPRLGTVLCDFGKSSINIHQIRLAFEKNGL